MEHSNDLHEPTPSGAGADAVSDAKKLSEDLPQTSDFSPEPKNGLVHENGENPMEKAARNNLPAVDAENAASPEKNAGEESAPDLCEADSLPETQQVLQPQKAPGGDTAFFSGIYDCFETFLAAAGFILLLFSFILRPARVIGSSMYSTLVEGDRLIVSDLFYTPVAGDIIVFQNHESARKTPIVKRVIATEGQWIDIRFNDDYTMTVWVADTPEALAETEPLDESDYVLYLTDQRLLSSWTYPLQVPQGCCFCMGDNRNHSLDSRSADIGFVNHDNIIGRVLIRILPITKFGIVS